MSPVSLDQLGYLEVMIPAFTQATLRPGWTGLTGVLEGGKGRCVNVCFRERARKRGASTQA